MITKEDLIGYKWAKRVIEGKEIANKWVKLECKRYIGRVDGEETDIEFDFKEADKIYKLLSVINYATGFYANKPIINHIHGFQAMILENIFCLFWKERDNLGFRRKVIEEAYLEIGRKAGKSFISGLINLLLMLTAEKYSQFACGGKTREISGLVRKAVEELINSSSAIRKHFKITREKITCKLNDSTMVHLSGEANNLLGKLLTAYVVDEVCNQLDTDIIDALKLSQMNTKQRMAIYISTQFDNPINAMNDLIDYHKKILQGLDDARNTFGLLFELDEGDSFKDENNWYKCNPLQMSFENGREFLRGEYKKGLSIESSMNKFRIYILNERLNVVGGESFVELKDWKKTEVETIDFTGRDVILGVDLSIAIDLSSVNATYKDDNNNYYSMSWGFLGRDSLVERSENFDYLSAERRGECFINDGRIVDYTAIKDFIVNFESNYNCNVTALVTDPFNALELMQNIDKECNFNVIFLKQTYQNLSAPTKEMQRAIVEGRYFHGKSKLYDIHIIDTQLSVGKSMDVMIDKALTRKKKGCHIDLTATSIFSMTQLINNKKKKNFNERLSENFIV
ncbi:terminase TerL endonuclease subunit [Clostridium saudiense]|uniref:terminase TerL endonuclease subunit n=1 Tax=Clostridium saudiense TaxID=1414720 RepID=UPI0008202B9B|nr:terminase TerL endonuclease subunit [Clostridium saudiense]MDU7455134.1 terminase TerL endonuclease subunit [Clostridium saudiense]SCJ17049.1 Phage terminase-like protein%2C large subunit [uncultured Clostridium sp.]